MSYRELKSKHVVGRKNYLCEWCGQKILKGHGQLYRAYMNEGDFKEGRMHLECEGAMLRSPRDELQDGWTFGEFERGKPGVPEENIGVETTIW